MHEPSLDATCSRPTALPRRRLAVRNRGRLLTRNTPLRERYARVRQPTPLPLPPRCPETARTAPKSPSRLLARAKIHSHRYSMTVYEISRLDDTSNCHYNARPKSSQGRPKQK